MVKTRMLVLVCALGLVVATACAKKKTEPTKEAAIAVLEDLAQDLAGGDFAGALEHLKTPEGIEKDKLKSMVAQLGERKEISATGVRLLAEKGKFGRLKEIFPDKGKRWSDRNHVPEDECYAFRLEDAEVAMHWDGGRFVVIRLDDVGKLQ